MLCVMGLIKWFLWRVIIEAVILQNKWLSVITLRPVKLVMKPALQVLALKDMVVTYVPTVTKVILSTFIILVHNVPVTQKLSFLHFLD